MSRSTKLVTLIVLVFSLSLVVGNAVALTPAAGARNDAADSPLPTPVSPSDTPAPTNRPTPTPVPTPMPTPTLWKLWLPGVFNGSPGPRPTPAAMGVGKSGEVWYHSNDVWADWRFFLAPQFVYNPIVSVVAKTPCVCYAAEVCPD